ncbi:MAG: 1-(5-phosphoribosyl)-5-[(5-phosphoribosylamino)methylideneamino]imidazole-4-carboxamide isomerase [Elusimicrobiota bacterium]
MLIIPAIDLRQGKCVRLRHGEVAQETIYSNDPVEMAKKWVAQGAKRLHVIDLDGAFTGVPQNLDWVVKIKNETGVQIQMGGGLRTMETIELVLSKGIDRVILGSAVVDHKSVVQKAMKKFSGKIIVGLDVKKDRVAVHGWKDASGIPLVEALGTVEKLGGQEIIFTDISRDGTLEGVNLPAIQQVMRQTRMKVVASGGVAEMSDIEKLLTINCPACVVGKALYEGKLDLAQAILKAEAK